MASAEIRWPEINDVDANSIHHVDLGRETTGEHSSPDAVCLLTLDGVPALCSRLHRNANETYPFRDACCWRRLFIIGWGNAFYVIHVDTNEVQRHQLDSYFGSFYANNEICLIASAERVIRIEPDGSVAWTSEPLGIDGVTFSHVDSEFVTGDGEWDPPGGWKPFRLHSDTGQRV